MVLKVNKSLKRDGTHLVLKQEVESVKISPKDVVENIDGLNNQLMQSEQKISQLKQQIQQVEKDLPDLRERLELFEKHKEWALGAQKSKAKALYNEIKDEVEKRVVDNYEKDPLIADESARVEMLHQFRHYVSVHPRVQEELAQSVIKDHFSGKDSLIKRKDSPFADYDFGEEE